MWIRLNTIGHGPHVPSREIWLNMDNVTTLIFRDRGRIFIGFAGSDEGAEYGGMTENQFTEIVNTKDKMTFMPDGGVSWDIAE